MVGLLKIIIELELVVFPVETIAAVPLDKQNIIAMILRPFPIFANFAIWFHSFGVEISAFSHIAYINFNWAELVVILHFEVVPVSVALSIGVTSHEAIELILLDPHS